MLSLNFDPFPVLTTERLILRRVVREDAETLFRFRTDERVLKYLLRDKAESMEEIYAFIEKGDEEIRQGNALWWGMELKDQPGFIGNVGYRISKKEHYRAEAGYSMFPEYFGKGLMNEAFVKTLEYAFQTIGLHSLEAVIDPDNLPSQKLLERNNFVREAYFREDYYYNGKFYDSAVYSLINPFEKNADADR
ncbi:MAG: alanine acetyltransferase [Bacteroidetes bacterium]|jgi:ribosomal-protein-alanine N-acetyltransferase|nr:alanine acetyltransferase [Bacteroidota bacterium]